MADSKVGPASNPSTQQERAHANARTKEEFDRETHGLRPDVDELTPISEVKAPNVFERAKEELEAIVHTIHPKKDHDPPNPDPSHSAAILEPKSESLDSEKSKKPHSLIEKAKESLKGKLHKKKPTHHKETHGRSDDIDETTPIDEIKGPNVFERAKEEVEAIIGAIHPNKDSGRVVSSTKDEGGLGVSVGKTLEKICSPGRSISSTKDEGGLGASMGRRLEKICSPRGGNKD